MADVDRERHVESRDFQVLPTDGRLVVQDWIHLQSFRVDAYRNRDGDSGLLW